MVQEVAENFQQSQGKAPHLQVLSKLRADLIKCPLPEEKLRVLESFVKNQKKLSIPLEIFSELSEKEKLIRLSLMAIGQEKLIFNGVDLECLIPVEAFYKEIGGIVGYHVTCVELLEQKGRKAKKGEYYPPEAIDISSESKEVLASTLSGIRNLKELAEIYPIGGAADRLSLKDEETGEFLSAAPLHFCGRPLVQRLIEDLQAREYLHYKLFGKQLHIPVVMMTSNEKHNDAHVKKLFRDNGWFGRRESDFFLFSQPLVPAMKANGQWCLTDPHTLFLKPGGHGVIWKLARDRGALDWLKQKGANKAFVRQINNVIAGVDYGLLAFLGIGFDQKRQFGFAGCPRAKGVSEGVNIVIENEKGFCLTNIEYCDVEHFEVSEDEPLLANTNLLFVDLPSLNDLIEKAPIPGMLVNGKKMKVPDQKGGFKEEEVLRLESTMQNLADVLYEDNAHLSKSYITSNHRKKTISTIKKEYAFGSSILQTPEQAFLDMLENGAELLMRCGFQVPSLQEAASFFKEGPSFIFTYHPTLGPLYRIIEQKLRGGKIEWGSELRLEIADLFLENLTLGGSLFIETDAVMGHRDQDGVIRYSNRTGKCHLKNVIVRNEGVNREVTRSYWKDEIIHKEKCEIIVEEGGEFYAEDVELKGNQRINVKRGTKVTATMVGGELILTEEPLQSPSWWWEYGESFSIHKKSG